MIRLLYLLPLSFFLTPLKASAQETDTLQKILQRMDETLPTHFVVTETKKATRTVTEYVSEERTEEYTVSVPHRKCVWRWNGRCWVQSCVTLYQSETRTRTVKIRKPVQKKVEIEYRTTRIIDGPSTEKTDYSRSVHIVKLGQLKAAVGPTYARMTAHFYGASQPKYMKPKKGEGESFEVFSYWAQNPEDATKRVLLRVKIAVLEAKEVAVIVQGWHVERSTPVDRLTNKSWRPTTETLTKFVKKEVAEIEEGFTKID